MKKIFLILIPFLFVGCDSTITFQIKTCKWEMEDPTKIPAEPCQVMQVEVSQGQRFGPILDYYEGKPFTLLSTDSREVEFVPDLVLAGEPINHPSPQNPKEIGLEETCFRTRTYDAGADICLKRVGEK